MSQFQPPQPNTGYPYRQPLQLDYAQPQAYQQEWQQPPYPPAPENYYPPTQEAFPSTQYPCTQPSPYQPSPPVSPLPQPPKKPMRRNDKIALGIIVSLVGAALLIVFSIAIAAGTSGA